MADGNVAPVGGSQIISNRLILPFLKNSTSIGITTSQTQIITPTREPAKSDTDFVFQFPSLPDQYLDLAGITLFVKGRLKRYKWYRFD